MSIKRVKFTMEVQTSPDTITTTLIEVEGPFTNSAHAIAAVENRLIGMEGKQADISEADIPFAETPPAPTPPVPPSNATVPPAPPATPPVAPPPAPPAPPTPPAAPPAPPAPPSAPPAPPTPPTAPPAPPTPPTAPPAPPAPPTGMVPPPPPAGAGTTPPPPPAGGARDALIAEINTIFEQDPKYRDFRLIIEAMKEASAPHGKTSVTAFTDEELARLKANISK